MVGLRFTAVSTESDETIAPGTPPELAVEELAARKAHAAVASRKECEMIVGADTVVVLDGVIYGKPKDREEAFSMLSLLSGRTHRVYTGVCILGPDGRELRFHEAADVEFYPLSTVEIWDYISTGEPVDKAGAYGIQGRGAVLVRRINGDFYNVMGLPIARVVRELNNF